MRIAAPVLGALPTAFFRVLLGTIGLAVIVTVLRTRIDFNGKLKPTLALGVINSGVPFLMYGVAGFLTRRWITDKGGLDAKLVAFGSQIGATLFLLPFFAVSAVVNHRKAGATQRSGPRWGWQVLSAPPMPTSFTSG